MAELEYFKHYDGADPYIFISYAHADAGEVMRVITDMHTRGFRLWYDEGIEVGSEWQECIASHLVDADLMVAFISNAYMKSDNCRKEMAFALSKKKRIINIFLEDTQLTPGMEMQLGNIYAIMKYTYPSEGYFYAKLYGAELFKVNSYGCESTEVNVTKRDEREAAHLKKEKERKKEAETRKIEKGNKKPRKRKKWVAPLTLVLVLIVLAAAAGVTGYFTGYLQRFTTKTVNAQTLAGDTVAVFENDVVEKAAREYTGKQTGDITVSDLAGITSLYIVGDRYWFYEPQRGADGTEATAETAAVTDADGDVVTAKRGSIKTLSDFAYFPSLTTLWVQFESISSLETMPACLVENLNIASNRVTSLSGVCNLPKLRTLVTDGCPVTDLSTLNQCLDLRTVSLLGSNASDYTVFKGLTYVTGVSVSNASVSELFDVLHLRRLSTAVFDGCDLGGSFFLAFLKEKNITSLTLQNCTLTNISDTQDFTALTSLTLRSCTGVTDWSPILQFPALKTLRIDQAMRDAMGGTPDSAPFEVTVD